MKYILKWVGIVYLVIGFVWMVAIPQVMEEGLGLLPMNRPPPKLEVIPQADDSLAKMLLWPLFALKPNWRQEWGLLPEE
jgi:hypothetical protein